MFWVICVGFYRLLGFLKCFFVLFDNVVSRNLDKICLFFWFLICFFILNYEINCHSLLLEKWDFQNISIDYFIFREACNIFCFRVTLRLAKYITIIWKSHRHAILNTYRSLLQYIIIIYLKTVLNRRNRVSLYISRIPILML